MHLKPVIRKHGRNYVSQWQYQYSTWVWEFDFAKRARKKNWNGRDKIVNSIAVYTLYDLQINEETGQELNMYHLNKITVDYTGKWT